LEQNGDWKEKQLQRLIIGISTAFFIALNISMRFIQDCDDPYLASPCLNLLYRLVVIIYFLVLLTLALYCKERLGNKNSTPKSSSSNSQKFVSKTCFFAITIGVVISIQVDVIITVLEQLNLFSWFPLGKYLLTLVLAEFLGQFLEYKEERFLKNILTNVVWNRFFGKFYT
jgi:hypothetical protein